MGNFNSVLFPGPAIETNVNYTNIIFIPRHSLPPAQADTFKEEKIGS